MTEILAILTTAKEAGFEMGTIVTIGIIAWKLRADVKKEVSRQVDKIVVAIAGHNARLDNLEGDVKEIKKRLG